jgi:hypothetical protein
MVSLAVFLLLVSVAGSRHFEQKLPLIARRLMRLKVSSDVDALILASLWLDSRLLRWSRSAFHFDVGSAPFTLINSHSQHIFVAIRPSSSP